MCALTHIIQEYTGGQEAIYKGTPILATHYVKRHIPRNLILDGIRSTDSGQTVIVVTGIAGCGKTQLVTDIVRELNPERDSRYVDCLGMTSWPVEWLPQVRLHFLYRWEFYY